ncbi:hypothetical protein K2173_005911 [Erythroxylum novogranatense]|uniref:DNA repair RAD52-like protein 2, chloroplastic n=1 Tax=Erythroxylum novogranatense TaxID=1862640 RepID=A0AAV8U359_9ROSI|nr:hypothetical protein K2173_005911 [Erythroxylum novogranatense]
MAVQSNNGLFLPIWPSSIIMNHMNSTKRRRLAICSNNIDWNKKKGGGGGGVPNSNYVVPLDKSLSSITRPLAEIFRDLNKRIPDNIVKTQSQSESFRDLNNNVKTQSQSQSPSPSIPWYHANRMLSFYAPGWCGEIRDVIFSDNGSVTVVYRVTVRGSDGEAHRESSATTSSTDAHIVDPVAAAEEIAFCRACARFGLGLYLYHEE